MLSSRLPIASAPVSCSSSSSSSTVSALPPSSTAAVSAPNHSSNKDELVAHDCPSDFLQSSGLLLSNGTGIKTMNLCVPEWDATGREMDMIWDPTELCSPSKGKCDSGQTRRPDLGFVPEHDFEELCWEDGQLIVMQGLSSKGNFKNRSYWQVSASETAPLLLGRPASGMDSTFDTMGMGTGELMDSSTVNMHAQDDELLSWLQHPCDELVDKLEIPSDAPPTSTAPSMGSERLCPGDFIHHGIRQNTMNAGETSSGPALKSLRYDTFLSSQTTMLHKPGHEHGDVPQHIHMNALTGSSITPTIITSSKEQFEHGSMMVRLEMPPPQMHPAMAVVNCGHSVSSGSMSSMNFSNFSRPAGAFKANFHSVGMANGPSGAERLKQLDRVAVDALKAESIDSTTKHLRLIAPKRGGVAPIAPNVSRSVGASVVHNRPQSFSLRREAEQGGSANGAVNGSSGMVDKSGDLNLSITSSAALGTEGSTEVLEVAEPSYTSSSGGSEESDGVDVKQATGVCKRKVNDEDSEIQSKSESTGTKKHATGGGKSMKGSRASKNHNQSERRRRDRISEKMKALQALVPNSYKTDKASMLEEAIAYVKALKAQIQMMSYRSGMYFSPMLTPQGMQHVQMAAWPHMGMGMGMGMGRGMCVGMGMHDMNMTSSQFSPLVSIPGAVMPAAHAAPSAALDSAWSMHVVPPPAHQIMVPIRPGNLSAGTCDSSPTPNVASHMLFPASQQQQPVQCTSPQIVVTGGHGNCMPYIH